MLAPLILFQFAAPPTEFAVYGLASDWWTGGEPPLIEVTQRGCPSCVLVRQFRAGTEIRRFKRTRTGIKVVPMCPTCYTYPPTR